MLPGVPRALRGGSDARGIDDALWPERPNSQQTAQLRPMQKGVWASTKKGASAATREGSTA